MFLKFFGPKPESASKVIRVGARVVRGPDWNSGYQDNGEGFLGTLVWNDDPDNKHVTVMWDSGKKFTYRAGNKHYDLRVYDSAPTGVIHPQVKCTGCETTPIYGMRWKCSTCRNVDLCTPCYMNDKHDITHIFVRIDKPNVTGVDVKPRANSSDSKKISKGTLIGAEVMRGPDWIQGDSDGGDVGYVEAIESWYSKYHRGAVKVYWKYNEFEDLYRVGAEGCVDVIYSRMTETAEGGQYYADHLPCVDFQKIDFTTWKGIIGKATAVYAYDAQDSDELSFNEGDTLLLLDCSYESWWLARKDSNDKNSEEGLFPANYVLLNYGKHRRDIIGTATTICDNNAVRPFELSFKSGEKLNLLECSANVPWVASKFGNESNNEEGLVSEKHVIINDGKHKRNIIGTATTICDNNAVGPFELSFKSGEKLNLLQCIADGLWVASKFENESNNEEGLVSEKHVIINDGKHKTDRENQIKSSSSVKEDPTAQLLRQLQEENEKLKKALESSFIGTATATVDYNALESNELSFKKGDILILLNCSDDRRWLARKFTNELNTTDGFISSTDVIINGGKYKRVILKVETCASVGSYCNKY